MDFDLSSEQDELARALTVLLERRAGPARCRELNADLAYDHELDDALAAAGFLDVFADEGGGPLTALLVVEAVAAALGNVAVGTRVLVLPALGLAEVPGPVALVDATRPGPVRFAAQARTFLIVDRETVSVRAADVATPAVPSPYVVPLGRPAVAHGDRTDLDPDLARRWWRTAIAAEAGALLGEAVAVTVQYVSDRHQFGRPLGGFQAVQHRLADALVAVEGTRWLARWSAGNDAEAQAAAAAATFAAEAIGRVSGHVHQVSGAMGFTSEHDLSLYTMRAHALRVELGGIAAHARALADARWG